MHNKEEQSHLDPISKLFVGYKNILIFIVYYFDFALLTKTLFAPWKREFWKKTSRGFNPSELIFVGVSNLVSRLIGAGIRTTMMLAGFAAVVSALLFGFLVSVLFSIIRKNSFIFSERVILSNRSAVWDWHFGYTPLTDQYSYELYYVDHNSDLIVGKSDELDTAARIFSQQKGHNILLVGEPGSGRHALLTELAYKHIDLRFMVFDCVSFLKGHKVQSEKSAALSEILREVQAAGNIVLILNHFETLLEFTTTMEPFLASSDIHVVGVTVPRYYHDQFLPTKSLMKYFATLQVEVLTESELRDIVKLRTKFSAWGTFPDSLITQLLAASNALASLEQKGQPEAIISLLDAFDSWTTSNKRKKGDTTPTLQELINSFLQDKLKVPSAAPLTEKEKKKLRSLETLLHQRVIAQHQAIEQISNALRRRRTQVSDINKAIGSFLFLGPTGVGKTETAKALATIFFEDGRKLLRFDMSRYQQKNQIGQLLDELARVVREQPYGVLLLDEIEKAHPDLLNIFLTIIDEGYFHDTHKAKVLCTNLIIIGTSNAASEYIRELALGGQEAVAQAMGTITSTTAETKQAADMQQKVIDHILKEKIYTPEFVNRFDAVVVYTPLSNKELKKIARMKLEKLRDQLQSKHQKTFTISDDILDTIVKQGTRKDFGARELDRTINKVVEDKIAEELLK